MEKVASYVFPQSLVGFCTTTNIFYINVFYENSFICTYVDGLMRKSIKSF